MDNEIYWKIYQYGLMTIVCMQDFDEVDYEQNRFVRNSKGEVHKFNTKKEAVEKLNEWYKSEEIDKKYRKDINENYLVRG